MADWIGQAGRVMLVAAVLLSLIAGLATLPAALRAHRRLMAIRATVGVARKDMVAARRRLTATREERQVLMVPLRRMRRRVTHPLLIALLQSLLRRRAR